MNDFLMSSKLSAESKYLFIVLSYLMVEQGERQRLGVKELLDIVGMSKTTFLTCIHSLKKGEFLTFSMDDEVSVEIELIENLNGFLYYGSGSIIKNILLSGSIRKRRIVKGNRGPQIINERSLSVQECLMVVYFLYNMNPTCWVKGVSLKNMSLVVSKSRQTARRIFRSLNDKMACYIGGDIFVIYDAPGLKTEYGTFYSFCRLNPKVLGFELFRIEEISPTNLLFSRDNNRLPTHLKKDFTCRESKIWGFINCDASVQRYSFHLSVIEVVMSRLFELAYIKEGEVIRPRFDQILRDEILLEILFSQLSKTNVTLSSLRSYRVLVKAAEVSFDFCLQYFTKYYGNRDLLSAKCVIVLISDEGLRLSFLR